MDLIHQWSEKDERVRMGVLLPKISTMVPRYYEDRIHTGNVETLYK